MRLFLNKLEKILFAKMTKIYTDPELDELWEEGLQTGEITYHDDVVESVEKWQHPLRKGVVSNIPLSQGLRTDITNFEYPAIWGHDYYCLNICLFINLDTRLLQFVGDVFIDPCSAPLHARGKGLLPRLFLSD
ncbi:hypothetical protein [Nostoc sp. CCY0012]|uniref:hypothetical protein n=1 Tax=Nostoc sp. CCY0012 TaxID=1056123 RepID=UPI0039C6DC90